MWDRAETLDPVVFTINDLKRLGSERLSKPSREYYNEGAMDLISLRDNEAAYDRYKIQPRILIDVSDVDTSTTLLGHKITFPLGFSPAAMHKLAHTDGELGTSRAAAKMKIPMALSTYATTSLEDVIAERKENPYMLHLSVMRNRKFTETSVRRAEAAGYHAILVSVDVPTIGRRLNEMRNDFVLPEGMEFPNVPASDDAVREESEEVLYDNSITWTALIPWLRSLTSKMEIWLKGVMTAEDIQHAIANNIDGVLISNHGGRQLDGVPATLDVLASCTNFPRGNTKIAIDGGIRRGSDIFKAVALGADICFVGRVPIWGLAYNGQAGVELGLEILRQEFETVMQLAGCRTVADIGRKHLALLDSSGRLAKL